MATEAPIATSVSGDGLAKPLHIQRVEKSLQMGHFIGYVENMLAEHNQSDVESSTDADTDVAKDSDTDVEGNKIINGIITTRAERKADKTRLYNFSRVKKSRKWLKNILLSDSSDDDDDGPPVGQEQRELQKIKERQDLHDMLKWQKLQCQYRAQFKREPEMLQYQYYSVGLLSNYDKFYEHQKTILGPKKKISKEQRKLERKMKAKLKKMKKEKQFPDSDDGEVEISPQVMAALRQHAAAAAAAKPAKVKKLTPEQIAAKRRKIWVAISKKEIPKAQKQKASAKKEMMSNLRKLAQQCQKECRRAAIQSQKTTKDIPGRARRLSKEMMVYWKRFEKVEKEHRKKAEKEAMEQRKMDLELREAKRQQRKLNFLITQTELYAHFMSKKLSGLSAERQTEILERLNEEKPKKQYEVEGGVLTDVNEDDYNSEQMKKLAVKNAQDALLSHQAKTKSYDDEVARNKQLMGVSMESAFSNPAISTEVERPQPSIFEGKLKCYQLKGMNWLANLYDQGINGILADEMGLGKTVQSIALLAHLAESQGIWGPFLVVAPASTLHNWQQECARFVPSIKVVPYWGNTQDRKILRQFWNQSHMHTQEASFHVVVTSYQLVIQDVKYFQRIKWHYMILDEAQAIKSSSSVRWKILLGFSCRNRLLLTGTPIQNSMAELWALLHFIMPTLFDSHEEFNEWFSKDIESYAEKQSGLDENQLSRLHMILKPFMLRRVKKDVENELSDKIEILVYCPLTSRQRYLYQAIKNKISIEDLLQSATASSTAQAQSTTSSLMNLVMQFRKVCNHPELFERREVRAPLFMKLEPYQIAKLIYREGLLQTAIQSKAHILYNKLYIFNSCHIHHSLLPRKSSDTFVDSCFSFTRFISLSARELNNVMLQGLLVRWLAIFLWLKQAYRIQHKHFWHQDIKTKYVGNEGFLIEPCRTTSPANIAACDNLQGLVFLDPRRPFYTHTTHVYHCMPETIAHCKIRLRRVSSRKNPLSPTKKTPRSPTKHIQHPISPTHAEKDDLTLLQVHRHRPRPARVFHCQPTDVPMFLYYKIPKLLAGTVDCFSADRSAAWECQRAALCGTLEARKSLLCGTAELYDEVRWAKFYFFPAQPEGLNAIQPNHGFSGVYVPDKETLVTDAGKLDVLDTLLARLKDEGHRVLIYSQMTRMIDLLEEYMWHRKHTYMRLDGSSKISDRRDMVADFQTRTDIFVFLLSTRAGGLGINLTAADTVIFYDSDWNPTVDQQAMDRAHRLGQTKQVTVYRLICKGTIEERILQRAKEKSEIQRMVISGGSFRPDVLKPKEVVSLLLDDDEMEKKLRQKQEEKRVKEEGYKKKGRKRKEDKDKPVEKKEDGRKRKKPEENNITIPAPDTDTGLSLDSMSAATSPQSVMSVGSEITPHSLTVMQADDSSNDALVIVDDGQPPTFPSAVTPPPPPPPKRGTGRSRGRPRGSGVGRRPRGRGSAKKSLSAITAAERAGAEAGRTAAYSAYGYSYTGRMGTPPSGKRTGGRSPGTGSSTATSSPFRDAPRNFYGSGSGSS